MVAGAGSCTCDSDTPTQRGSFSLLVRLDLLLLPGVMTRSQTAQQPWIRIKTQRTLA